MKEIYHSPIVETDQLFDVEAGDMSILARCWGLTSPNGSYSHAAGGCKD